MGWSIFYFGSIFGGIKNGIHFSYFLFVVQNSLESNFYYFIFEVQKNWGPIFRGSKKIVVQFILGSKFWGWSILFLVQHFLGSKKWGPFILFPFLEGSKTFWGPFFVRGPIYIIFWGSKKWGGQLLLFYF